jgi:tetratricopeptide (TPR) repeat protein
MEGSIGHFDGVARVAKLQQFKRALNSPAELRSRAEQAATEGRFQTALDLAKQLNKLEPNRHSELLNRCYLGRAKQLREQGATLDAATMLESALSLLNGDPVNLVKVAEELAQAGEFNRAMLLLNQLPDPKPPNRIPQLTADASILRGANGRAMLPESMHADFDRVRQAFSNLETGRDDQAREAMQGIGLGSPFLEWKLLLRGLYAFYQKDDDRAIENWSRLDPARFPARLAAPLRAPIDPAFRSAQSAEAQQIIRRQSERLLGNPVLDRLNNLRRLMHQGNRLNPALREIQPVLATLKQQQPELFDRLADCFYWEIVDHGHPDDVPRYKQLFGQPLDDPGFSRVTALRMERESGYVDAHDIWRHFQNDLSMHPTLTQTERDRARAMVWLRMAENAQKQNDVVRATAKLQELPFGLDIQPRPLKPGAEECLRKAIELAPDWLDPHFALFQQLLNRNQLAQAIAMGRDLLRRFPDHLPTLEALADLLRRDGMVDQAAALLEQAHNANPLNRELRNRFGQTKRLMAGQLAAAGNFEPARSAFQTALQLIEPSEQFFTLTAWAACEFKAGDSAKAEELLLQAAANETLREAISANLYALATAWKLPKPVKSRFDKAFKEQLAAAPTPSAAVALAALYAQFQVDRFEYYGFKSQRKKVLALAGAVYLCRISEAQMIRLGSALLTLKAVRLLRQLAAQWQRHFPKSAYPVYFEIETYLANDNAGWFPWRLKPLVERARNLAEKMPPGADRDTLLNSCDEFFRQLHDLDPFAGLFEHFMDRFDEEGPDDDNWEDERW